MICGCSHLSLKLHEVLWAKGKSYLYLVIGCFSFARIVAGQGRCQKGSTEDWERARVMHTEYTPKNPHLDPQYLSFKTAIFFRLTCGKERNYKIDLFILWQREI